MGLKSGDAGAKAQLKSTCARAFRSCDSLLEARKVVCATREQTAVIIDMNVVLMSVPQSVCTLHGFLNIVWSFVEWAIGTGWFVVLVFDEPNYMTNAKRLEQKRRDAARNAHSIPCSVDIDPFPFTDDYSVHDLESSEQILSIRDKRPCRSRLYDEVAKRVFKMAAEKAAKWNASGNPAHRTVVLMDGVDIRGCERPAFEARSAGMVCNDDAIGLAFKRGVPIGEGDIKLQAVEDRIRELAGPDDLLHGTNLVMSSTIDTDSLMISALAISKRRVKPFGASVLTLLCMRNPASRAQNEDGSKAAASYLVVDTSMLEGLILENIYGKGTIVSPEQALNTMLALASCAALSGCDFCSLSGARFDHFFLSMADFVRSEPLALQAFGNCTSKNVADATRACDGLLRVCYTASYFMEKKGKRYAKQSKSVGDVDEPTLRRAIWTASYWSQNEFQANETFGFATPVNKMFETTVD